MNADLEVVFSKKSSKINKEMIKFFRDTVPQTASLGIIIDFQVAQAEDADYYKGLGVKDFPVIIFKNNKITGVRPIKNFIIKTINDKKNVSKAKSVDDDLNDYWINTLGGLKKNKENKFIIDDKDQDEENTFDTEVKNRMQLEVERRKITTAVTPKDFNPGRRPGQQGIRREGVEGDGGAKRTTPRSAPPPRAPPTRGRGGGGGGVPSTHAPPSRGGSAPRRATAGRRDNITPPSTVEVLAGLSNNGAEASDDALMAKYFANQEETMIP